MITELLNDSITWTFEYTVITELKKLKICFAFGFLRVFVIWVKRFLGAFKRHQKLKICFAFGFLRVFVIWVKRFLGAFKKHQVYSLCIALHFITKGTAITSIIVIMKGW